MKNDRRHSDESDESLQIVDDSDDNESDSDDEPESAEEEEEASEETSEDVSHDEDQKRPRRWKRVGTVKSRKGTSRSPLYGRQQVLDCNSEDEDEEASFAIDLQQRAYYEHVERKQFESMSEKRAQMLANRYLYVHRRTREQIERDKQMKMLCDSGILWSLAPLGRDLEEHEMFAAHRAFLHDVNEMDGSKESRVGRPRTRTCDVSHGCTTVDPESVGWVKKNVLSQEKVSENSELAVPAYRLVTNNAKYDTSKTRKFAYRYKKGLIHHNKEPEKPKQRKRIKFSHPIESATSTGRFVMDPEVGRHFDMRRWYSEEVCLFKELFSAYGRDWSAISHAMGGIKSPTAVKNFFYDVRTPIFGDMLGLDVDIDHVMRKIKPELRETVEHSRIISSRIKSLALSLGSDEEDASSVSSGWETSSSPDEMAVEESKEWMDDFRESVSSASLEERRKISRRQKRDKMVFQIARVIQSQNENRPIEPSFLPTTINKTSLGQGDAFYDGETVFVYYECPARLKSPHWFEATVVRGRSSRMGYEWKVIIHRMKENKCFWTTADKLARRLPIGTEVWQFNYEDDVHSTNENVRSEPSHSVAGHIVSPHPRFRSLVASDIRSCNNKFPHVPRSMSSSASSSSSRIRLNCREILCRLVETHSTTEDKRKGKRNVDLHERLVRSVNVPLDLKVFRFKTKELKSTGNLELFDDCMMAGVASTDSIFTATRSKHVLMEDEMLAEALSTVLVACLSAFHMHSQNERQKSVTPGLIHTELLLEMRRIQQGRSEMIRESVLEVIRSSDTDEVVRSLRDITRDYALFKHRLSTIASQVYEAWCELGQQKESFSYTPGDETSVMSQKRKRKRKRSSASSEHVSPLSPFASCQNVDLHVPRENAVTDENVRKQRRASEGDLSWEGAADEHGRDVPSVFRFELQ